MVPSYVGWHESIWCLESTDGGWRWLDGWMVGWLVGWLVVWFGLVWFGLGWVGLVWFGLVWLVGWLDTKQFQEYISNKMFFVAVNGSGDTGRNADGTLITLILYNSMVFKMPVLELMSFNARSNERHPLLWVFAWNQEKTMTSITGEEEKEAILDACANARSLKLSVQVKWMKRRCQACVVSVMVWICVVGSSVRVLMYFWM